MTVRVKICGLKTDLMVAAALAARTDFVGFVFYPPSSRNIAIADAAPLAELASGVAAVVALTVDADDAMLDAIMRQVRPDMLQLHGSESPERVAAIRVRWGTPVMKAIMVATAADAAAALAYRDAADMVLFDAKPRKDAVLPGGNGAAFDWHVLDAVKNQVPFMLSGGLTPVNVAEAVGISGASAVDVSSGVETGPGDKSADLIRRFIHAAKAAQRGV